MKERAAELEKEKSRGRGNKKAAEELDLLAKLESMDPADRALAERRLGHHGGNNRSWLPHRSG